MEVKVVAGDKTIQTAIVDSCITSSFRIEEDRLLFAPKAKQSNKVVTTAFGHMSWTVELCHLPLAQLQGKVQKVEVLLGLKNRLLGISKFSDKGYTTIFHFHDDDAIVVAVPMNVDCIMYQ